MLLRFVSRRCVRALLVLVPVLAVARTLSAQTPGEPLAPATRVRVHTGASSVVQGEVLRMTTDSIVFREELSRGRLALALPQIRRLDRSIGHPGLRDRIVGFALAGALTGGIVGYSLTEGDPCVDRSCKPPRLAITLGSGAFFAAVGAIAAGIVTPERWETILDRPAR